MAKTRFGNHIPVDYDPYRWSCSRCGEEREYTQGEIDKLKKPYPDPQNHDFDCYISCPFCQKGVMEPPQLVFFGGAFEEIGEE
ncbi:MAG: hypothetical protein JO249_15300 [Acidobacteria bacterium]|nr:hypothetical protein [Acidobacteriota bacterium]